MSNHVLGKEQSHMVLNMVGGEDVDFAFSQRFMQRESTASR